MDTARTSYATICQRNGAVVLVQSFTGKMAKCCAAKQHAWTSCSAARGCGLSSRRSFCSPIWIRALAEQIPIKSTCGKSQNSTDQGHGRDWPFMRLRVGSEKLDRKQDPKLPGSLS